MKYIIVSVFLFLMVNKSYAQLPDFIEDIAATDSIYDKNIHTVQLRTSATLNTVFKISKNNKKSIDDPNLNLMPVIPLKSSNKLLLSFDDFSSDRQFQYTIIHCSYDWKFSDLEYLDFLGSFTDDAINDINFSSGTRINYSHHRAVFPNENISPKLAGNYLLVVYDEETEDIILTKRFAIYDNSALVSSSKVWYARSPKKRDTHQEITATVHTNKINNYTLPEEIKVVAQQNGRWDNAVFNIPYSTLKNNSIIYDRIGNADFESGAEFRTFDILSLLTFGERVDKIYQSKNNEFSANLITDKPNNPFYYRDNFDINGGYLIHKLNSNFPSTQSDYVQVSFTFQPKKEKLNGSIYILGAFNNWKLNEKVKMNFYPEDGGIYKKKILLKQGYYNYAYVFIPTIKNEKATFTPLEYNFSQTDNQYRVYIYHRANNNLLEYDNLLDVSTLKIN